LDNPTVEKQRIEKTTQTMKNNPELETRRRDNISISRRKYFKSLSENNSIESHYLYLMQHQTKPIIKIGLTNEKNLQRRIHDLSRDFGDCKPIFLVKDTYKKIDELESYLHDYFKDHCKIQPSGGGRTEWFDECILEDVKDILTS
jgi:hypothetical protein